MPDRSDCPDLDPLSETRESQEADERLQQSFSLLRTAMAVTRDGVLLIGDSGGILGFNRRFAEMWGMPQDALDSGREGEVRSYIRTQLEEPEAYRRMVERTATEREEELLEVLRLKDGRVFECFTCPQWKAGSVVGRAWSFADMTHTRRAQDALWESELRYRTLFEGSRHAVYITTRDGRFVSANQAARELFGFSEEEMPELNARDFYAVPKDRKGFQEEIEENGFVRDYPVKLRNMEGAVMDCLVTSSIRRDPSGEVLEYEGIVDDITERKQAQESLEASERRFRALIENAQDTITLIDRKGRITYESPAVERILGYRPSARIGTDLFRYLHPDDRPGVREEFLSLSRGPGRIARTEFRHRHLDNSWRTLEVVGQNLLDDPAIAGIVINARDVTERKAAEEQLIFDALHDRLTGLPNRVLFMDRLSHLLKRLTRDENAGFAVLFLDLDEFKVVNDSLGHMLGDQLLVALGRQLTGCVRPGDTVARLGGDEFALLLDDAPTLEEAEMVANRVHASLAAPFILGGHEVYTTASIGITQGTRAYRRGEDILRDADLAMYRAKSQGRGKHVVFDGTMHAEAMALLRMETDLRRALERGEFQPYFQPILSFGSGSLRGFEVLVRWVHPEEGLLLPADFLSIAEKSHLVAPIGWLMLEQACAHLAEWAEAFGEENTPHINVNISPDQFFQGRIERRIAAVLRETRAPGHSLTLELTESSIMESPEAAINTLRNLKKLGIGIVIDDFGTGYSSLSYLHRFPVDGLKIDRSFVQPLGEKKEEGIVRGIISLAGDLGMATSAEGVENAVQLKMLDELGCGEVQGFLFSEPVPVEEATGMLETPERWAESFPWKSEAEGQVP
mgnify:CR=1 FL=1